MKRLHHLTINTGNVARTSRDQVDQATIDFLRHMIDNEEGGFPPLNIGFDLFRPWTPDKKPMKGAAVFNLTPWPRKDGDLPYVTAYACWNDDMAEALWAEIWDMIAGYREVAEAAGYPSLTVQAIPPEAPWLAVMLFPEMAFNLDPDRIKMLGDIERCLFWALAEGSAS